MNEALEGEVVNSETPLEFTQTKHDETIVKLLETAFKHAYNISEACQYAGISRVTFYNWLADDDIFSYRMSLAQAKPITKAKDIITSAINSGDVNTARWFVERRDPDFKPRAVIEPPESQKRVEEKLKEFMDDTDDGAYPNPAHDGSAEPATEDEPSGGEEVAPSPTDIS